MIEVPKGPDARAFLIEQGTLVPADKRAPIPTRTNYRSLPLDGVARRAAAARIERAREALTKKSRAV